MSLTVPNAAETLVLQKLLNQVLTLRLFSNNKTPGETDTVGSYTEVAGGGYAGKALAYASWTVSEGVAAYPAQTFTFTGATTAPGTIYGYYVTDASGDLLWAERFDASVVPFIPIAGSKIRITPRITCS